MQQPQRQVNRSQTAVTSSQPAPVGGWNARDSIANMDPSDAALMVNWLPTTSDLVMRSGYTNWATGIGAQVNTLMQYNALGTNRKLFAAAGSGIYDVTTQGAVGAPVVTGLNNSQWQYVNFSTPGGQFLCAVNGVDSYQVYNGAAWQAVTAVSAPISLTGVTTSQLVHVNAFKQRLYFIQANSLSAWYLPPNSVGGAASQLDFGAIFKRGGYLMAMATWSLDAGYGMDDYAVWITSEGEVAVYKGTDPSSASTWSLIGVYLIGAPLGRRCFAKYSGDLALICRDGLVPFSRDLMSSRVNTSVALSNKIQWAISTATSNYSGNFGWQVQLYPDQNMILLNVPVGIGSQEQYVMNTVTGSWCRFTGWAANCWELWQDKIYFGGNGVVNLAWNGTTDNGVAITAEAIPAFSYFGAQSQLKRFTMARPILNTNGSPGILMGLNIDFDTSSPIGVPTYSPTATAIWDASLWDAAVWGNDMTIKRDWQYVSGLGYAAALHMKVTSSNAIVRWVSTDYVMEAGGVL